MMPITDHALSRSLKSNTAPAMVSTKLMRPAMVVRAAPARCAERPVSEKINTKSEPNNDAGSSKGSTSGACHGGATSRPQRKATL